MIEGRAGREGGVGTPILSNGEGGTAVAAASRGPADADAVADADAEESN